MSDIASGEPIRLGRFLLLWLVATGAIFAVFYLADLAADGSGISTFAQKRLWPYQLAGSALLGFLAVAMDRWESSAGRQAWADAQMTELLDLRALMSKLPRSEFQGFANLAQSPSRDGVIMMEALPATRQLWLALEEHGWATSESEKIPEASGFVGYSLTERGFRGLPLLVAPVLKEWNRLGDQLDEIIRNDGTDEGE